MRNQINYTSAQLKQALTIVSDYLLTSLLNNPLNTKIKLGSIGYFIKKERTGQANLTEDKQTCFYYHCQFKKSPSLKKALYQQILSHAQMR